MGECSGPRIFLRQFLRNSIALLRCFIGQGLARLLHAVRETCALVIMHAG
ncbi:hypothetical protein DyAD56_08830 [Dyella sp. AD56]|nr:hypothetical protein DyAD56_08830 [Dyella sp. AD56]